MQLPSLSKDEQYKLLEQDKVPDIVREYLNGDISGIGKLITLTQDEYLAWALSQPLRDDGWVHRSPGTQDGVYFLRKSDTWWTVYQQDRGEILWKKGFNSYEDARRYLAIDYGLGRFLGPGVEAQNADKKETESDLTSPVNGTKPPKKWWQVW